MTIGISTYAFFWQWHATAAQPLSLTDMIAKTAGWDVELFQICDYPLIESYDDASSAALRSARRRTRAWRWSSAPAGCGPSTSAATSSSPRRWTSRWSAA